MATPSSRAFARTALSAAIGALLALAGCASMERGQDTPAAAAATQAAAAPAVPTRSVASFAEELRCMDYLLVDYGARDLTVSVDEKVNTGVKGMLASAVSDMTRRSRAIRLMAYGPEAGQAIKPQYVVRGSLTQNDGTGLDLALLTTQDLAVVPGVTARNHVPRGRPEITKFGMRLRLADGDTQSTRALVELSSIELFGRLAKVPYWTCLGTSDDDPAVAAEIRDWYDAMAARPSEIIEYFQTQMRVRRLYDGPIDGVVNAQIKDAVARYRDALGLSREPKLSQEFLKAYLKANHRELEAKVRPAAAAAPATAPAAPAPPAAPLALHVAAANDARKFARGEVVQLTVKPSRDAHVYCFHQDENQKISRFFPNRFHRDSRVAAAEGVRLPGAMRFEIRMNPRGVQETVSCFATDRDVLADLPGGLGAADFETLPVASLEQVRSVFASVSGGAMAQEVFRVEPK